jgi:phosphoglycerol transferase MdoB-like AlkP superfamily enzyme
MFFVNIYAHYQNSTTWLNSVNVNVGLLQELLIVTILFLFILLIKNRKIKIFSILSLFALYYLVYVLQIFSVDLTGAVLNLVSLNNAGQALLLLNSTVILKTLALLVAFFVIIKIALYNTQLNIKQVLVSSFVIVALYIGVLQYKHSKYFSVDAHTAYDFSPLKEFYNLVKLDLSERNKGVVTKLSDEELEIAKRFNLDINTSSMYPFEKKVLYKDAFPFETIKQIKPNVIILFVESLSARLIGAYRDEMKVVTPNIDQFAKDSMVVKGYYNHATPTAPGLYGQNCSIYPLLTFQDMDATPNILQGTKLKCMAEYIYDDGYKTFYFSHTRGHYTHFDQNFKLWGYKNVVLWKEITNSFLKNEDIILGEAGSSDHQMMRATANFLKQDLKEPFLVGISTIETHVGFKPNSVDGLFYKDGSSDTLNMIYNFDDAFGIFWKAFKKSKYYNNTIVILTGDHTLYPNNDFKKVAGDDWIPSVYDELSLIIYDPIHKLPKEYQVNAASVDLAPTVLHLLGIKKENKNSFMGTSLFDKKENNTSFGVSAYSDFNYFYNIDGKVVNSKIEYIKDKNDKKIFNSLVNIMKYSKYLRQNGYY